MSVSDINRCSVLENGARPEVSHASVRHRRVRLDRLRRRPRAARRRPSGRRPRPLRCLRRPPHRRRRGGAARHHRRPRNAAQLRCSGGRCDPSRLPARCRVLGGLRGRRRRGSSRRGDLRRSAGGLGSPIRPRIRDPRPRAGSGGHREGWARRIRDGRPAPRSADPVWHLRAGALPRGPRGPLLDRAPRPHQPRRGGPGLHRDPHRHRPRPGPLRLHRRRLQPLDRRAPARFGTPLPAGR